MPQSSPTGSFSYTSIMVHVDLAAAATKRVELARTLAARFKAQLVGVAAEQPFTDYYGDAAIAMSEQMAAEEKRRVAGDVARAEALFRAHTATGADAGTILEWRSGARNSTDFLIEQARVADLVIIGRQGQDDEIDWRLGIVPGDVILDLGRPVLLVPPAVTELSANRVIVAWKDAREARRALSDSMPFLMAADEVLLVSIGDNSASRGMEDIAAYLSRRGVRPPRLIHAAQQASVFSHLLEVADSEDADLIVAGAYGHSRLREWVLGGVTRELLETTPVCCLLAH